MIHVCNAYHSDLEPNFKKFFLRLLDIDDGLVIDVYYITIDFAKTLENLEFQKLTKFLENLGLVNHGNSSNQQ